MDSNSGCCNTTPQLCRLRYHHVSALHYTSFPARQQIVVGGMILPLFVFFCRTKSYKRMFWLFYSTTFPQKNVPWTLEWLFCGAESLSKNLTEDSRVSWSRIRRSKKSFHSFLGLFLSKWKICSVWMVQSVFGSTLEELFSVAVKMLNYASFVANLQLLILSSLALLLNEFRLPFSKKL